MFAWTRPDAPLLKQQEQFMNKLLRKQGISLELSVFPTFLSVVIDTWQGATLNNWQGTERKDLFGLIAWGKSVVEKAWWQEFEWASHILPALKSKKKTGNVFSLSNLKVHPQWPTLSSKAHSLPKQYQQGTKSKNTLADVVYLTFKLINVLENCEFYTIVCWPGY